MKEKRWLTNNCIDCNISISSKAIRCKSCNGKHIFKPLSDCIICYRPLITYGSKTHKECYLNQKRNTKNYCMACFCEIDVRSNRCMSCFNKFQIGENHPNFGNRYSKSICNDCGKEISYGSTRCQKHGISHSLKKSHIRFNKSEQLVDKLLISLLGKKYKFVGDGKIMFDRFNPDFININGEKKIIEFYGDYWHNKPQSKLADKRRLKTYKKYGYETLILWESELRANIDYVVSKILAFHEEINNG